MKGVAYDLWELMTLNVAFCAQDDRVDLAAIMMRDRNVGALPVVEQQIALLACLRTETSL